MAGGAQASGEGQDRFTALASLAAECAAVDVVELTDGEVLDAVLSVATALGQLESVLAKGSASLKARSLHALEQARSVESWLAAHTELSHGRAKALVTSGRALPACPHVDRAYVGGDLGSPKVEAMVEVRVGVEGLFAEHEAALIEQIQPLTVRQAKIVLKHWRLLALATLGLDDGPKPGEDESLNSLHVSGTYLGRFRVDGNLDAITGKRLAEALEAEREARFRSGEWSADDGLTTSQRNAIILADLLEGSPLARDLDANDEASEGAGTSTGASPDADADAEVDADESEVASEASEPESAASGAAGRCTCGAAGRGGPRAAATRGGRARPAVSILWDAKDLLGEAADEVADLLHRRCVLGEDHSLSRSVAERLLCDADVTDVVMHLGLNGRKTPLGVVHTQRYPTAKERAALVARDGGCVFPGCDTPARWADAHHTVPYEAGRRTALHELVLLCKRHHHAVHDGGYTLWRTPHDGRVHVTDPDGRLLPEVGRGHKLPPPAPPERRPKTVFRARARDGDAAA
ncbi:MAG: HNH endonuclease [Actinobacteria bacterium]|nr:HNH endonuclease [Actinomycetota bacterium]